MWANLHISQVPTEANMALIVGKLYDNKQCDDTFR
jgi:hypothetical protein